MPQGNATPHELQQRNASRRRGSQLLESIYEATTALIQQEGYANLSFQQIARAVRTSRTVLYRRWATPLDLVREIMVYRASQSLGSSFVDNVTDTGSLRGDLLHLLTIYQKMYDDVGPEIMNAFLFEMSQNNLRLEDISSNAVHSNIEATEKILAFARARGETVRPLGTMALTLPFDLVRIGNLWGVRTFDRQGLEELVDDILLPVFSGGTDDA